MFEITGAHIADLNDTDLRTLVARLALAELRAQGCPSSSVTAGGNQDAADGGLDVRVECPSVLTAPDFVPRALTGFQVKKPDMPASAIRDEMRPDGRCQSNGAGSFRSGYQRNTANRCRVSFLFNPTGVLAHRTVDQAFPEHN